MKTIEKSIDIDAPKEKVWAVLVEEMYNKDWFSIFSDGTIARTDWIEGHKVSFVNKAGDGIVGRILEKKPYEKLVYEYDGMIAGGNEDYESDLALATKGTREIYTLREHGGKTRLQVEVDIDDAHHAGMDRSWEAAMQRIAELARSV